jgi:hypothetical protein
MMRLPACLAMLATTAALAQAPPGTGRVTCTNPASGATWPVVIDDAHQTVDGFPARFGDEAITWLDSRDGGHYRLDRATGALRVIIASSTGGYFLHDRCRPAAHG